MVYKFFDKNNSGGTVKESAEELHKQLKNSKKGKYNQLL